MSKRRTRTAAQRRATARLVALNRARAHAASAPRRTRRRRRTNPVAPLLPARRRRRRTTAAAATRAGRVLRARRRNPIRGLGGFGDIGAFASGTLVPAAVGGVGALGVDVLLGVLPLPMFLRTGAMLPVTRVAGAVGLGLLAAQVTDRRTAHNVTAGAVTVVLYETLRGALIGAGVRLPGLGDDEVFDDYLDDIDPELAKLGYRGAGLQVGNVDLEPNHEAMGVYLGPDPQEQGMGVYLDPDE